MKAEKWSQPETINSLASNIEKIDILLTFSIDLSFALFVKKSITTHVAK